MSENDIDKAPASVATDHEDGGVEKRRELLKKGLAGGGAIAGAVWVKPVINSAILPAHATTSVGGALSLSGSSGPFMLVDSGAPGDTTGETKSLASRVVDVVIPSASAAGTPAGFPANFTFASELSFCVNLGFPQGATPSGPINVSVTAPTVTGYAGSYNLSSSGSGMLSGLDFDVNLSDSGGDLLNVTGCLTDSDFSGAEGYVELVRDTPITGTGYDEFTGYGGSFTASNGGACSPGSGLDFGYGFPQ